MTYKNHEGYSDPTAGMAIKNVMEVKNMNEIKRGDIYFNERNNPDSETRNGVLVVGQNNEGTHIQIINLKNRDIPGYSNVPVLARIQMTAMCHEINTIHRDFLTEYVRTCTDQEMDDIEKAVIWEITGKTLSKKSTQQTQPSGVSKIDLIKAETERDIYKGLYDGLLQKLTN